MLKPKQKQAAEIAVSEPDLSGFKIAERVGVDVNTYYRWKKNPEFTEYIHSLCEDRFKDMEKLAMQKLKEHIETSRDGFIHTSNGTHIQVRSKDSKPYHPIYSARYGREVSNKNHAFYFQKQFVYDVRKAYGE